MSLLVCHTHLQEKKKAMQEEEEKDQALQAKASLAIPLVPESEDDRRLAALLRLHTLDCECWHQAGRFIGSRCCRVWRHLVPRGPLFTLVGRKLKDRGVLCAHCAPGLLALV